MANVPRFFYFLVWCGAVWGDRFIITPSEFFKEKGTFYSVIYVFSQPFVQITKVESITFY